MFILLYAMTYNDNVNKLLFNYFLDMRKKEIDKRERANLIAKYLKETGKSQRALAKELGIPHSTIQDWLMINRISEKKYDELIESGETDTGIYRMLRNNKKAKSNEFNSLLLNRDIDKAISKYKPLINKGKDFDSKTIEKIKDLVSILNRIMIHNEREMMG